MQRSALGALAVVGLLFALGTRAYADREPTPDERARIETVLRENGFTNWSEIEFDDGQWEIDDALAGDGGKFDLKLDEAMKIIEREAD